MACKLCKDTGLVPINETVDQSCPNGCMDKLQQEYELQFRLTHPEMSEAELIDARLGLVAAGQSQVARNRKQSASQDDGVLEQT